MPLVLRRYALCSKSTTTATLLHFINQIKAGPILVSVIFVHPTENLFSHILKMLHSGALNYHLYAVDTQLFISFQLDSLLKTSLTYKLLWVTLLNE